MPDLLRDIAARFTEGSNPGTKTAADSDLYGLYQNYLDHLRDQPFTLLEIGVYFGESLKAFATYFPRANIIGVDLLDRGADFSSFSNIVFEIADQREETQLSNICTRYAPDGPDIIIDDGSHIGTWSLLTYRALFPRLKPGGLYCVEDWGAGYMDGWHDAGPFQRVEPVLFDFESREGKRIESHDFGMAGFAKHLMDELIMGGPDPAAQIEWMHIHRGMVVVKKKAPAGHE